MSTVNITTNVNPATANGLRMNLYLASAPLAVINSIDQAWQAENRWTFTNLLPGTTYIYNLYEVDANNLTLQQYTNNPSFTPPSAGSIEVKPPQDIEVDVTPGVIQGNNTATFTDWIGWDLTVEEVGTGTMKRGEAYSYDSTTGVFALLGQDHVFISNQRYFVRFEPRVSPVSSIVVKDAWSDLLVVSQDYQMAVGDIDKKIIISATGTTLNLTLPDFSLVPKNRLIYIESDKGNHINASIIGSANSINWLEGNRTKLYIGTNESIVMYAGLLKFRVHSSDGNFKTVGRMFWSDRDAEYNAVELNGAGLKANEYARLYNDYVLKLSPSQIVQPSDWFLGNNKYKFSFADASGVFRVPDLRGMYMVNSGGLALNSITNPGDFIPQQLLDFRVHTIANVNTGDKYPTPTTSVAATSNRQLGNQDYELCKAPDVPVVGISGPPVDKNGVPFATGNKLRPDSVAARLFINT